MEAPMNVLFENTFVVTKDSLKELNQHYRQKLFLFSALPGGLLILLGFTLQALVFAPAPHFLSCTLCSFGGLLVLYPFFHLPGTINSQYRTQILMSGSTTPSISISFMEDHLQFISYNHGSSSFSYSQIVKFSETSCFYSLNIKNLFWLTLKKDSFTIGDPAEFKSFLRTKCPHLKIK
ncbi:MAG: YcxB family protein [Clostridiales bacterium]|nr:YcxB family protein [Clostridiales bacterium]